MKTLYRPGWFLPFVWFGLLGAGLLDGALPEYDAVISADTAAGRKPLAALLLPATFNDANRSSFNFGASSGDVTMEFIVEGDPVGGGPDGYLAVGANSLSSLRYEQWNNTSQVGFTQGGVADYLFAPAVPSPTESVHLAFVWLAATRTMQLYVNGSVGGVATGVSSAFSMPRGAGYLGNNSALSEGMKGTIHRVTVYDDALPAEALQRHADAFTGASRPPLLLNFQADPATLFSPSSTLLSWEVAKADRITLDGSDVTGLTSATVTPDVTHVYELIASNSGGSATGRVQVTVNPGPRIRSFTADRRFAGAGEPVRLSWEVDYAQTFSLAPGPIDVTGQTTEGRGSVEVFPMADSTFQLTARSPFGESRAEVRIQVVQPATHLVISEVLAANDGLLRDEDGESSDWIELYNPTPSPIRLQGYWLTDDRGDLTKWGFPDLTVPPRSHQLVFASGKNRIRPDAPLHTNFQLDPDGEYLALVGPGPRVLHEFAPEYPAQSVDISYGLLAGDLSTLRFLGVPTPGQPNLDTPPPPAPVQFSRASGTITNSFDLTLASPSAGVQIRYTLDGSTPTASNGLVYAAPLRIDQTRRVRAVAIADGRASALSGASYIKLAADLIGYQSTLPILLIENFGAGVIPQKGWSGDGSGIKQVPRQSAIWATFDRVGSNGLSALTNAPEMFSRIGIRGRGAFSSTWRQKPFSVEAENEQGEEEDVSPLGMPKHSEWILYYPDALEDNKDPTMLFNTFAYELSRRTGRYSVRFRWVEAFLNEDGGELKLADRRGVYVILEKVSRGKDRLDFEPLSADGSAGGWLLNINRMDPEPETGWPAPNGARQPWFFHTAGPDRRLQSAPNSPVSGDDLPQQSNGYLNFDNPNGYTINVQQRAAIEAWFKKFEDVFFNSALWRDPTNGYRRHLDTLDFADYFILNTLTHNGDGLLISMFPWKGRDEKLRMGPAWDYNWSPYYVGAAPTGDLLWRSEQIWYARLFNDPDFVQEYIDRWWSLRAGPMSDAGMDAIVDEQAAEITPPKALLNGVPSATEWANRLGTLKNWLKTRANWIDGNYVRPPYFNQPGGPIPNGFQLVIGGTNGTVYYTLDGTDPRLPGGAVSPQAITYLTPITLNFQTEIRARLKRGNNWSGLTQGLFVPPQDLTHLALTEIMYNPPNFGAFPGDDLEFVELKNTGATSLQLGGLTFTDGIQFTFTNGASVAPGGRVVLARNLAAFTARYPGVSVNGVFGGRLDNDGERLTLSTAVGGEVFSVAYNDRFPWPLTPDGYGFSLVPRAAGANGTPSSGAHWRASSAAGGSPGRDDPAPAGAPFGILINEMQSHTAPPALDRVELHNPGQEAVDISGWFLSDDGATPRKYRFPAASIVPARGYLVLDERDFNPANGGTTAFSLKATGDDLYLTAADAEGRFTGYGHGVSFGPSDATQSLGRYVNSVGDEHFVIQAAPSFGAGNADPIVGPVVIQEVHYHPEDLADTFVELKNISGVAVRLFDSLAPTNTWRLQGFGFQFPSGLSLAAGQLAVVVASDPLDFRSRHAIPAEALVLGGATGALQNNGERLELQRPGWLDGTNGWVYLPVDGVRYDDRAPWPSAADGGGPSLQRRVANAYADDPASWLAARPTPGRDLAQGVAPRITLQPEDHAVVAYLSTRFRVEAEGTEPLFYQWLFRGEPLVGETQPNLVLPEVQPSQAGEYQAIVFNGFGSILSRPAVLTPILPATIVQQPASRATNVGGRVSFSVTALGIGTLRYQWFFNGSLLSQATNTSLTLTNVQPANGGDYHVTVADDIGTTRSQTAVLTVNVKPTIVLSPQSQTVVEREPVVFLLRMSGTPPFNVRWRRSTTVLTNLVVNGFESTFVLPAVTTGQAGSYNALVGNAAASSVASGNATLTVLTDADRDGLPDVYEAQTPGLSASLAADALLDFDGDGFNNLSEYRAGTDPNDPASVLRILEAVAQESGLLLRFRTVANRTYAVEYRDALEVESTGWQTLSNLPPAGVTGVGEAIDNRPGRGERFYRVRTP